MRRTFWLARLLASATAVYLVVAWLGSGDVNVPFLALAEAALALAAAVLRKPRRGSLKWLLPFVIAIYSLGILVGLTLHLRMGLPASERTVPSILLILGLALGLRSIYQVTKRDRLGMPNYFDAPAGSSRQHVRAQSESRPKRNR